MAVARAFASCSLRHFEDRRNGLSSSLAPLDFAIAEREGCTQPAYIFTTSGCEHQAFREAVNLQATTNKKQK